MKYLKLFEDYTQENDLLIKAFSEREIFKSILNKLIEEGYFDYTTYLNDSLVVYRKIAIKKDGYDKFKDNLNSKSSLGVFWSLHNFVENLPYGHDEYDNTPENTYLIQFKGVVNIDNDIDYQKTRELYNYDSDNMISEAEIVLNKVHVIEMLNEDTGEIISLNIKYNIDYRLN